MKKIMAYFAFAAVLASCVDGFKDEETWAPSVRNAQLQSPAASDITVAFSADGENHTISWPVVLGAGGYEVTVYKTPKPADPDTWEIVGNEKEAVDGLSITRPAEPDTRYMAHVRTLGNPKYNNAEATAPAEKAYTNLVNPSAPPIPSGTNLTDFFTTDTIPLTCDSILCYDLEPNGTYTMSGNINHRQSSFILRGDKNFPATLTITGGSFINGGAGFRLQYMTVEYSGGTAPLIQMSSTFNEANLPTATQGSNAYLVVPTTDPITLLKLDIRNMQSNLFHGNAQRYAVGMFLIKDCVIGYNTSSFNGAVIYCGGTNDRMTIKDFTMQNSTLYNVAKNSNGNYRFMELHGTSANAITNIPGGEVWGNGSLIVTGCTFWQAGPGAQSTNRRRGQWGPAGDKIIIERCVFVDSYNDNSEDRAASNAIIRRFRSYSNGQSSPASFSASRNSYWYDGKFVQGEIDHEIGDKSGTHLTTDPNLSFNGVGADKLFTMSGAEQLQYRTGDPRWLPLP